MTTKSIRQVKNLAGKKVLLRADFNIPIINGAIADDYKIVATLPTIRFLLRHKTKVIIISHLGNGQKGESLKIVAARLAELLGRKVGFVSDCIGIKVKKAVAAIENGDILLLENLRFHRQELENFSWFARELAELADIYVNDSFGVDHRMHASLAAIKKYLPSYAGLLLESEIVNLNKIKQPVKPLVSVIGGAKIHDKTKLIKKLLIRSDRLLVGGAVANNFLAARGFNIGKSLADKTSIKLAKKLDNLKIILPLDVIVSTKMKHGQAVLKSINQVKKNDIILDIGLKTIKLYAKYIKKANTIIWNGPMGMFEQEHFKHGTMAVARLIAGRSTGRAFGVVGGGETIEALKMTKMIDYIDWVSTGGGAMLSYLGGEKMPGLERIVK